MEPDAGTAPPAADAPGPRPLLLPALGFAAGICLAGPLGLGPTAWLGATAGCLVAALCLRRGGRSRRLLLAGAALCLGGQAMSAAQADLPATHLQLLPEATLEAPLRLEGWVAVPPDPFPAERRDAGEAERTRFVAEVERIEVGGRWQEATGRARLTLLGEAGPLGYGQSLRGSFRLRRPRAFGNPGAFDYPAYLAAQGISLEGWSREPLEPGESRRGGRLLGAIHALRALLLERLEAVLPSDRGALLRAVVLGDRSGLTTAMQEAFLGSGTYHILAISGLNVSLLAGTLFGGLRLLRASPRLAAAGSLLLVTLYAALAGGSPSVVRAAVMADVYLLAILLDRRGELLNSLALSALLLLWWNPRWLFEVGFQLTYLATLGIVLTVPAVSARFVGAPRPLRHLLESVAITLAATAMTAPVLATAFNRLAPVGLIANLPVVPLAGLVTALGLGTGASLLVVPEGLPWLTRAAGEAAGALLRTAGWFAEWPGAAVRVYTPTPGMVLCYYGALAALLLATRRRGRFPASRRARWAAGALAAALAAAGAGQALVKLSAERGRETVRLTLLDVGQAEAMLLRLPGGRHLMVDAGGSGGFDTGRQVLAPYLLREWIGHLEALAVSHAAADHVRGLPGLLEAVTVEAVWVPPLAESGITGIWLEEFLRHRRIPLRILTSDEPARLHGPARLEVLHPPPVPRLERVPGCRSRGEANEAGLVLRVSLGERALLLTGDIGCRGEAALLAGERSIRADVLKVAHHGSRFSSGEAFLRAVGPRVAVVSAGYRNQFRHPHPEVVDRLAAQGIALWRTDLHGAVEVELTPEGPAARGWRVTGP